MTHRIKFPKEVMTTGEVAEICGVSFRTVIRWIDKGLLRAGKLPGRGDRRIHASDLEDFLKSQKILPLGANLGSKTKILVIDNEKRMAHAIARALNTGGYSTAIATSGIQAGQLLHVMQPSLITLDLKMPGVDGFEVIRHIRAQQHLNQTKILVLSGLPEEEIRLALSMGADSGLKKPFQNESLLQEVNFLLRQDSKEVINGSTSVESINRRR